MGFTLDYKTELGQVRGLLGDILEASYRWEDDQLEMFLTLEGDDIYYAASDALMSLAQSYVLRGKIKIMDLELDGATAAKDMRALAKDLRDQSDSQPDFDIAKMLTNKSSRNQDRFNEIVQTDTEIDFIEDL